MFNLKSLALISAVVSGALAEDVYSRFSGVIGAFHPDFKIGDPGCFSLAGPAYKVNIHSENQNGGFDGPYCLHAYSKSGCNPGDATGTQQFEHIGFEDTPVIDFDLQDGVKQAASYYWTTTTC